MKKIIPFVVLALGVLYIASSVGALRNPSKHSDFDIVGFGKLPVVTNGRVKPLDTVARTAILLFQGRQRVAIPELASTAERTATSSSSWAIVESGPGSSLARSMIGATWRLPSSASVPGSMETVG